MTLNDIEVRYRGKLLSVINYTMDMSGSYRITAEDVKIELPDITINPFEYKVKEKQMSKFKVGDRVRIVNNNGAARSYIAPIGSETFIIEIDKGGKWPITVEGNGVNWCAIEYSNIELVNKGEEMTYQRRTFKQLTESVTVKKNALWQEACDDGDQEYILLNESDNKDPRNTQRIYDRSLVEEGKGFVEVFKVSPEYMTKEELNSFETFKKSTKKTVGRPKKVATPVKKRKYTKKVTK